MLLAVLLTGWWHRNFGCGRQLVTYLGSCARLALCLDHEVVDGSWLPWFTGNWGGDILALCIHLSLTKDSLTASQHQAFSSISLFSGLTEKPTQPFSFFYLLFLQHMGLQLTLLFVFVYRFRNVRQWLSSIFSYTDCHEAKIQKANTVKTK